MLKIKIKLINIKAHVVNMYICSWSENCLRMIGDCDEEDKIVFQEISDSQEPTNNDINYEIYSWANYSTKYTTTILMQLKYWTN